MFTLENALAACWTAYGNYYNACMEGRNPLTGGACFRPNWETYSLYLNTFSDYEN